MARFPWRSGLEDRDFLEVGLVGERCSLRESDSYPGVSPFVIARHHGTRALGGPYPPAITCDAGAGSRDLGASELDKVLPPQSRRELSGGQSQAFVIFAWLFCPLLDF